MRLLPRFVLGEERARPEWVDEVVVAPEIANRFLEGRHRAAPDAEDFEEVVPEGLGFGAFAGFVDPIA